MIKVTVPATSANLGCGFDTYGLALDLSADFSFEIIESGLVIDGCDPAYQNEVDGHHLSGAHRGGHGG